jgi:hypothetical protein
MYGAGIPVLRGSASGSYAKQVTDMYTTGHLTSATLSHTVLNGAVVLVLTDYRPV